MLSVLAFLAMCGIPQEKMNHTHYQWGNRPRDHEQKFHGSLTILSIEDDERRLNVDFTSNVGSDSPETLEVEVSISDSGFINVAEGEINDAKLRAFADSVKELPLIICGEA